MKHLPKGTGVRLLLAALAAFAPVAYGFFSAEFRGRGVPDGSIVEVLIPDGAASLEVADVLQERELIFHPRIFDAYVRLKGQGRQLKAGRYGIPRGAPYPYLLDVLRTGAVVTTPLTIPEGLRLPQVAERLAAYVGDSAAAVLAYLTAPERVDELGVPGPTLEGYLFPETYRFADGVGVRVIVQAVVGRYRGFWGGEERAQAAALGLDEREVVTLASIVEKEVRRDEERPVVAGVYWNRLQRDMLLQADPTVQYALGEPRARLLYRDIDSVADHPYNTYTQPGLPPGPIASPGAASLRAALQPAHHEYIFFVARNDGSHEFTRTLREHNNARNRIRLDRESAER
ncbi:MAG: endolytic transglycosylase MltG [Gemmatimonadales bacterium]|nr:endolytic transglycosylase MltG [Gemmatimonadales bacterium]MYG49411.1 endolytic transglycosylase MltG [Gemmatimonadales bacterium]MYK02236.1 endolytic transglycosylase MltG [Candidatus Palauibacter ramosifaciens]